VCGSWHPGGVASALLALVAAVFVLACGGDGDSEQLRALRADPMAAFAPAGTRLLRESGSPERAGGSFDKPQEARYSRRLVVPESEGARVLRAAAAAARAARWELRVARPGASFTGDKRLATGPARLTITLGPDPLGGSASTLNITLSHDRV
jgi:hypothetical protein